MLSHLVFRPIDLWLFGCKLLIWKERKSPTSTPLSLLNLTSQFFTENWKKKKKPDNSIDIRKSLVKMSTLEAVFIKGIYSRRHMDSWLGRKQHRKLSVKCFSQIPILLQVNNSNYFAAFWCVAVAWRQVKLRSELVNRQNSSYHMLLQKSSLQDQLNIC